MAEFEATFDWPYNAGNVVVTGDFDNWSQSVKLTKSGNGFTGTVKLPYGSSVHYKFVVDGHWVTRDDLPTDSNESGIVNNVIKTPPKDEATNATHTIAPLSESAAAVNGIAPSAAEVAAEKGPEPEELPATEQALNTTAEVSKSVVESATAAAAGLAATATAYVNGDKKAEEEPAPATSTEVTTPEHAAPIKALADATTMHPIVASVHEYIAPHTPAPASLPHPDEIPSGEPLKALADATTPSKPIAAVQDVAAAASEFVGGINGAQTPAAAEVSEEKVVPAAPIPAVPENFAIDSAAPAVDPVVSPSEEKAAEASTPGKTEVPAAVATKAVELAAGAAAAVGASVAAAAAGAGIVGGEKKEETTAATEPSTLTSVASAVASNVGIALKSLTGVDPINSDPIPISETPADAPVTAAPSSSAPAGTDDSVPVVAHAGSKTVVPVEHVPVPSAPETVAAAASASPSTAVPAPAPIPVAPSTPTKERPSTSSIRGDGASSPNPSHSSKTFPTLGSAHSTPSKDGSVRKKRTSSFFGKVKDIFHKDKGEKNGNGADSPKKGSRMSSS